MAAKAIEAARAFVRVAWEDSAIRKGIERAQAQMRSFAAGAAKVGSAMAVAGGSVLGAFSTAALQFTKAGAELDDMANRTGVSVEQLSRLSYAADQTGTNIGAVEKGMRKLSKTVVDAAGGSETAAEALEAVGLSAKDLQGMNPDQQFLAMAAAISRIADPGEKAAAAMAIFGEEGAQLVPMLNEGASGIMKLMTRAEELGVVMGADQAKAAAEFDDAWNDTKAVLSAVVNQIGAAVVPALLEIVQAVLPVISATAGWIRENAGIVKAVAIAAAAVGVLGAALVGLAGFVTALSIAFGALTSPIALTVGALVALGAAGIQAMGGFGAVVDMLSGALPGLTEAVRVTFGALNEALKSGEYGKAANILWLSLKVAWLTGIDALNKEWLIWKQAFINVFNDAVNYVAGVWTKLQNKLAGGILEIMAKFDSSINLEEAQKTLQEDFQRSLQVRAEVAQTQQNNRDEQFAKDMMATNAELEAAQAEWRNLVGSTLATKTDTEQKAAVDSEKLNALMDQIGSGQMQQSIQAATSAPTTKVGDIRTVSGAGQLTSLINRSGQVNQQMLSVLQIIAKNTNGIADPPQLVNI